MRSKVAFSIFVLLSIVVPISLGRSMEIILRGGDCQCAGPALKTGCEHGVLQGYGLGLVGYGGSGVGVGGGLNSGDCSTTPRFRIRTPQNPIKYIFDYNLEVPIGEPSKIDVPLTGLVARVDKILVEKGSPKYVNTDCTCANANAVQKGIVGPCPVHAVAACAASQSFRHH